MVSWSGEERTGVEGIGSEWIGFTDRIGQDGIGLDGNGLVSRMG